ncbi:hypothetical protein Hdeb2414_s0007g00225681 [Helianthus debilis subsp. tardiflorus]
MTGGRDIRPAEGSMNGKHDKEKGVNAQVIVWCRPLNDEEMKAHTLVGLHVLRTGEKFVQYRI